MILLLLFAILFHPIHISVCEINFSQSSRTLQIIQRIFADDLETGLNKLNGTQVDILELNEDVRNRSIEKYLKDKINITIDGEKIDLIFLGSEIEEGVCWIYLESMPLEKPKNFIIENTPLFELFDDQSTIIQVLNSEGNVINFRLFGEKIKDSITFN